MNIFGNAFAGSQGDYQNFPGVTALDDVSLTLDKGEVLCLVGENGAGKSTLIKTLAGIYQPDKGDIFLEASGKRF